MGWGIRVSFQKLASDPTEYVEDDFKLYPQVISPVSLRKKNHSYCSLIPRDQSLLSAWGEAEEEFLGSHGFHSKGDYGRLTAIRGGP